MRLVSVLFLMMFSAVVMINPLAAYAQEGDAAATQESSVQVDKDKVSDLIKTLESETARQEFIDNLKTMLEVQDEDGADAKEAAASLSEALGIRAEISNLVDSYDRFLIEHNLNGSLLGQALSSVLLILLSLFLIYLVRKGGVWLRDRLLDIEQRYNIRHDRFRLYARGLRYFGYTVINLMLLYSLIVLWNISDLGFFHSDFFYGALKEVIVIVLIALGAAVIWEIISGSIDYGLSRAAARSELTRLNTLLPILRNVLFVVFALLFTLVLLSEIGINIVPLLAGAGVVGIAVGFGAQTMVKDFLNGFTIILEDLIQVGDVAKLGDRVGLIEKITIRKVQLRDLQGIVYTVPFSEISIIENWTKEFSFYLMDIGIAYRENTDEVIEYLKEIDEELRKDETFGPLILEPLHILGVDQFADSAVIIKARIKTKPIKQWDVGREFNRRMKIKFDEKGVEIPFPHQTVYFGEDKDGKAPPARLIMDDVPEAAEKKKSSKASSKKSAKKATSKKASE
jgi:small conductance mechanosensitive channel